MPGPLRESVITLVGGPGDRQVVYVSDWEERRLAAERMGRTADEFCGWPLASQPETHGSTLGSGPVETGGERWPRKPSAGQAA